MRDLSIAFMPTLKKQFTTSLCLILLILPMKTQAEDILEKIPAPDKVINLYLGQKAPYSGVFMSEDQFRFFKTVELESQMFSKKMNDTGPSFSDYVWVAAGFFVFGLAAGSLAK